MILKNFNNVNLDNFPVVIFGSGPAGIATALELPPIKLHCSVLAEEAIVKAVAEWDKRNKP